MRTAQLTEADYLALIEKAEDKIQWYDMYYFKDELQSDGVSNTYWEYCQSKFWDGMGDIEEFKECLSIQAVINCLHIQAVINKLPYDRYNVLIETTDMIRYAPSNSPHFAQSELCKGFDTNCILGYLLQSGGDVELTLSRLIGDADVFESYAADIRATEF